jgi:hypothetical protein
MSRKGVGSSALFFTTRILPVCWMMKTRPLPSPACVMPTGDGTPETNGWMASVGRPGDCARAAPESELSVRMKTVVRTQSSRTVVKTLDFITPLPFTEGTTFRLSVRDEVQLPRLLFDGRVELLARALVRRLTVSEQRFLQRRQLAVEARVRHRGGEV